MNGAALILKVKKIAQSCETQDHWETLADWLQNIQKNFSFVDFYHAMAVCKMEFDKWAKNKDDKNEESK